MPESHSMDSCSNSRWQAPRHDFPGAIAASAAGADAVGESSSLSEIAVTAQREQSLLKTSLALDLVSTKELENADVVQVRDLSAVVPRLIIGRGGAATQVYVRGVGDFGSTPVTNPTVAFNVDGV